MPWRAGGIDANAALGRSGLSLAATAARLLFGDRHRLGSLGRRPGIAAASRHIMRIARRLGQSRRVTGGEALVKSLVKLLARFVFAGGHVPVSDPPASAWPKERENVVGQRRQGARQCAEGQGRAQANTEGRHRGFWRCGEQRNKHMGSG